MKELLGLVGLADLGERYPHQLSGGQQQRVALARALAVQPSLVLLDEPFAALDAQLRATLREEVIDILRSQDTTTVLVTHDQAEALSSADHLGLLQAGRVHQAGTPAQLYDEPVDREVATFLGEANILPGAATPTGVTTHLGTLTPRTAPSSREVDVLVRPEQIHLHPAEASEAGWQVASIEYFGHDALYHLRTTNNPGTDHLQARALPEPTIRPHDYVTLTVQGPVTT